MKAFSYSVYICYLDKIIFFVNDNCIDFGYCYSLSNYDPYGDNDYDYYWNCNCYNCYKWQGESGIFY